MKRTLFSLFVVMMATCLWAQDITETKNGVKVNIAKSGIDRKSVV